MKISRENLLALSEQLSKLGRLCDDVKEHSLDWIDRVDAFEVDKYDADWQRREIADSRESLEESLEHLETFLAWLFDYLHTERRALELETGKYLQSLGND